MRNPDSTQGSHMPEVPGGWVYVLHFSAPLSHACHYVGSTYMPQQRLEQHALGDGAVLTKVLYDIDIDWILAALYRCDFPRKVEAMLKRRNNGPRHCPLCNRTPPPIKGAKSYPLDGLSFPITARELRANLE